MVINIGDCYKTLPHVNDINEGGQSARLFKVVLGLVWKLMSPSRLKRLSGNKLIFPLTPSNLEGDLSSLSN